MCGVVAVLRDGAGMGPSAADALDVLSHRGPDRACTWVSPDGRMELGHTRLSIIGLDNGDQPLHNDRGDVHAVVNGEFYGYRAIRDELRNRGRRFATDSDSEIALALYEEFGADCLERLRGEFAFVIADERRRCLFAARDRFGIKPLFYTVWNGTVLIASEIKALLALGVPARWDEGALIADCLFARPPHRSLFRGICALPPGCFLRAWDGQVQVQRYWDLDYPLAEGLAADDRSDQEVVAGFRAVLDDAVAERLVADVEVAAYLSGGIDSCAVLGLAQHRLQRPIRAFTISFGDAMYDETTLARDTAKAVGAEFVPIPLTQQQVADGFSDTVWHSETLVHNGHGVAKFLLSAAVRDAGIKVVFTGEGADEFLGGYAPYRRDVLLHHSPHLADTERDRLLRELDAANVSARGLMTREGEAAEGLATFARRLGFVPSLFESFSGLGTRLIGMLREDLRHRAEVADPFGDLLDSVDVNGQLAGRDRLNQSLYLVCVTGLPHYVLACLGDRVEMAHSVEGRVPFLDHRVAEYVARLPIRHKIRNLREKHVLREAVRDCVIPEVYQRQKHPFMTPPARTDDDPMTVMCQDVLRSRVLEDQPLFDPGRVRAFLDRLATMSPAERGAAEGVVLRMVSACLMHERFGLGV